MTERTCTKCDYEHCASPYGWPCAGQAKRIEDEHWKRTVGTTDLAARGYRSYWD